MLTLKQVLSHFTKEILKTKEITSFFKKLNHAVGGGGGSDFLRLLNSIRAATATTTSTTTITIGKIGICPVGDVEPVDVGVGDVEVVELVRVNEST